MAGGRPSARQCGQPTGRATLDSKLVSKHCALPGMKQEAILSFEFSDLTTISQFL